MSLQVLRDVWDGCTRCTLSQHRKRVVHWRGNPGAPLVVIGEAPGEEEDRSGVPFFGPSGRKLDEILSQAGIDPEHDVLITNTVACRPPDNRDPLQEELRACGPRLEGILTEVRPRALLLLGAVAARRMAGLGSVSGWRGQRVAVEIWGADGVTFSAPAIPTFHPSYVLREPHTEPVVVADALAAWVMTMEPAAPQTVQVVQTQESAPSRPREVAAPPRPLFPQLGSLMRAPAQLDLRVPYLTGPERETFRAMVEVGVVSSFRVTTCARCRAPVPIARDVVGRQIKTHCSRQCYEASGGQNGQQSKQ